MGPDQQARGTVAAKACGSAPKWDLFGTGLINLISLRKRAKWWVPIGADRNPAETGNSHRKSSPLYAFRVGSPFDAEAQMTSAQRQGFLPCGNFGPNSDASDPTLRCVRIEILTGSGPFRETLLGDRVALLAPAREIGCWPVLQLIDHPAAIDRQRVAAQRNPSPRVSR